MRKTALLLLASLFLAFVAPLALSLPDFQSNLPLALVSAQSTSLTLTLLPASGSNPVSTTNYFTVVYTAGNGSVVTAKYTGTPLTLNVSGKPVNISAASSGSGSSEEWCLAMSGGKCIPESFTPSSASVTFYYYDLLSFTVEFSVKDGGTGYSAPSLTYMSAPLSPSSTGQLSTNTFTLSSTPVTIWAARGTQITVPATLLGSGTVQRWATNVTGWTVGSTSPPPGNITYYNQYYVALNPTVSGGSLGTTNEVPVVYTQFGGITTSFLTGPGSVWADAGGVLGWSAPTNGGSSSIQYSAAQLTYGLVGYWQLSEGSGKQVLDLSGSGNSGTAVNSPSWLSGSACLLSYCLSLNGVNQYVVAGSNGLPTGSSGFTKVIWVYLPNGLSAQEEDRALLCWGSGAFAGGENCLATGAAQGTLVNTFGGGVSLSWTSTHIRDGWNMIAVTYNGSLVQGYVNGVLEATYPVLALAVQPTSVYMGGGFAGFGYFDHAIQEVRIYNFALSPAQITVYYHAKIQSLEGQVSSPGVNFMAVYYRQNRESTWYTVIGGGNPTAPNLTFYSIGEQFSQTLSTKPTSIWMDSASSCTVTNPVLALSGTERWETNGTTFQPPASGTVHLLYFNQYLLNASFQVLFGGSGYGAANLSYTSLGKASYTALSESGTPVWADNGTSWHVSPVLAGSGSSERWATDSVTSGLVSGPARLTFVYYHQYFVEFLYSVKDGGTGYGSPQVNYTAFGGVAKAPTGVGVWADAFSTYRFSNPLPGSGTEERWYTPVPNGTVNGAGEVALVYYHQFLLTVIYQVVGGGAPPAPVINVTDFGSLKQVVLTSGVNHMWVDSGSTYYLTPVLSVSTEPGERWVSSVAPENVSGPLGVNAVYRNQYYVRTYSNEQTGGTTTPGSGWYNSSTTLNISASASPGWRFERWIGGGPSSYSGNLSAMTLVVNSPITEEAVFYPGLNLTVQVGGTVSYSYPGASGSKGSGATYTLFVPPGTTMTIAEHPIPVLYTAKGFVTSQGVLPPNATIVVNSPSAITAEFEPNYTSIALIGAVVVVALLIALLMVARARRGPGAV